jgi:hypothetical protein
MVATKRGLLLSNFKGGWGGAGNASVGVCGGRVAGRLPKTRACRAINVRRFHSRTKANQRNCGRPGSTHSGPRGCGRGTGMVQSALILGVWEDARRCQSKSFVVQPSHSVARRWRAAPPAAPRQRRPSRACAWCAGVRIGPSACEVGEHARPEGGRGRQLTGHPFAPAAGCKWHGNRAGRCGGMAPCAGLHVASRGSAPQPRGRKSSGCRRRGARDG